MKIDRNMKKVMEKISSHKEFIVVLNEIHMMEQSGELCTTMILTCNK